MRGRILTLARQQIGYREPGNYCTIFGPCEEWCSLFVTWVWRHAGVPVPKLAFTGYLYDWASATTFVRPPRGVPQPGDAVLFGSGPWSVSTSLHVGIVEAVYPGYLVTIEGDSVHGVRRYVVPLRNPRIIGEPGPIYAYASPVATAQSARVRPRSAAMWATPRRPVVIRAAHRPSLEKRRLMRTIAALRAFQHMPTSFGQAQITWTGVDRYGLVDVTVASALPLSYASAQWQGFLARFHDAGHAYSVTFQSPPDPPAAAGSPSISGTAQEGQTLTETHGSWSNSPTTYAYQWESCDTAGGSCVPISGATSQNYTASSSDVGHTIRVQEIAANAGGSGQPAVSAPTAVIGAAAPSSG